MQQMLVLYGQPIGQLCFADVTLAKGLGKHQRIDCSICREEYDWARRLDKVSASSPSFAARMGSGRCFQDCIKSESSCAI